eukprot:1009280-Rhodomonas_salina.1
MRTERRRGRACRVSDGDVCVCLRACADAQGGVGTRGGREGGRGNVMLRRECGGRGWWCTRWRMRRLASASRPRARRSAGPPPASPPPLDSHTKLNSRPLTSPPAHSLSLPTSPSLASPPLPSAQLSSAQLTSSAQLSA